MAIDRTRTLRGALAGAAAAALWTLQQPIDKRVFGCRYDDVEMLGRAVTHGPGWRVAGTALHVQNGALFGAVYANAVPSMPLPAPLKGPAAALLETAVTWPLAPLVDRLHPARDKLPRLWGNNAALAQAVWRHVLFGVVLGELERRLNPPAPDPPSEADAAAHASNGHGAPERIASPTA